MSYKKADELMEEFQKDWEAAMNPSVDEMVARCNPAHRQKLAEMLDQYLCWAPTPPYSPVQQRRMSEQLKGRMGSRLDRIFEEGWKEFNEGPDGYAQQPPLEKLRRRVSFFLTCLKLRLLYTGPVGRMRTKPWD